MAKPNSNVSIKSEASAKTRYGYIYHFIFTRPTDGHKFHYVGQHLGTKADSGYYGSGLILKRLINKYGKKGDLKRLGLMWCYSRDALNFAETLMICFAKAVYGDDCINLNHWGADGCRDEYSRARQSATMNALYDSTEGARIKAWISTSLKSYYDSEEGVLARAKISATHKGKAETAEARKNIIEGNRAYHASPEGARKRVQMVESIRCHYRSPEGAATKAAISASLRSHYESPEGAAHRASVIAANTGKSPTQETRNKLRAANVGRVLTSQARLKISEAHKGKVLSQEHRDKIETGWALRRAILRIL